MNDVERVLMRNFSGVARMFKLWSHSHSSGLDRSKSKKIDVNESEWDWSKRVWIDVNCTGCPSNSEFILKFYYSLLTFKALHGMAPNYNRDLLTIRAQGRYSLRSNNSIVLEVPRGKMLRSFGDCSFSMAAPKIWNELPLAIHSNT